MPMKSPISGMRSRAVLSVNLSLLLTLLVCLSLLSPAFPLFPSKVRTVAAKLVAKLTPRRKPPQAHPAPARRASEAREAEEEEEKEEARFDKPDEAAEYFRQKRMPAGVSEVPLEKYLVAQEQMRLLPVFSTSLNRYLPEETKAIRAYQPEAPNQPTALGGWSFMGPGNIGGRTRALVINPNNPDIMYAGGVAGGVWKTTNGGALWVPVSDLIANLAICSLVMDPDNPNILYAGTGEPFTGSGVRGLGIFKTTDGGATWTHLANTANNPNFYYVTQLVVSPGNSQRLYAATLMGIFRSLDGGVNWTQVHNPGRCDDLVIRTDQANDYVFAACRPVVNSELQGTIYRNTNAGSAGTWDQVYTEAALGRVGLALAPSNQNTIYALAASKVGGPGNNYFNGLHAVFRSTTSGNPGSWAKRVGNDSATKLNTLLLTNVGLYACATSYFNQGSYDLEIAVDPINSDRVWVGGIDVFRSDDGGANWGYAPCGIHPDQHVIVFHPQYNGTTNQTVFFGNDGGIAKTVNANAPMSTGTPACGASCAGTVSFTSINNNYGVTQFYHGLPYPNGESYFGGTQDNGVVRGSEQGGTGWSPILQGDGGYVAVHPTITNTLYTENYNLSIQKSTNGGASWSSAVNGITNAGFQFIVPFVMDPTDPQRLWTGGNALWRTSNGAGLWNQASTNLSGSVSALSVSPLNNGNRVLAGTNTGFIYRNDNATAANNQTVWTGTQPRSNSYVSWLAHDPTNQNVAYATYSTFGGTHVWKSVDGGTTWTGLDGTAPNNLPDVPVHCLVVDPNNTTRLYIGTDVGVFSSLDGGVNWAKENTGFANVITESLSINSSGSTRFLFAFTHGRGVWRVALSSDPACPTVTSVAPTFAGSGSTVVINGDHFLGATEVRFSNNVSAPFSVISNTKIQITVPPGAGSGPLTIRKTSCADVTTPNLTICLNPAETLSVDDGSYELLLGGWGSNVMQASYVNRLTPSGYPATLTQVSVYSNLPAGTTFDILVGANADGDTNISGTTFTATSATAAPNSLVTYNVPSLTINSGDFVIGYRYINSPPGMFPVSFDDDDPSAARSYFSTNGSTFSSFTNAGRPVDLPVRGTVFVGPCGNNTAPTFTPAAALSRQQGSPAGATVQVGTVNDAQTPVGNLVVTQIAGGTATGISITSIVNTNGVITAQVSAACNAVAGTVRFQVSDGSLTGTGDLQVNVTPNTQPTLTYNNATATTGIATTVNPATGPSDNGTISSIVVQSVTPSTAPGTITVNNTTGVVSVSNNVPSGSYTVTIRATDNCSAVRDASFTLTVTCQTITVTNPGVTMGTFGAAFSQTFTQIGGIGTTNFSTASTLPTGLSLSATGVLSGTPTQTGTFPIIVKATDSNGCMGTGATYTLVISAGGGSGLQFYPLAQPVRLLETRAGFSGCTTPGLSINANGTLTLPARTACTGIPANAAAVTGNITVVPTGAGFLTLFPSSATQPTVANSNFRAGEVTNNVFTVGLGAGDGAFKIFSSATTHVIVDVTGYYAPPDTGGLYFHPLPSPVRLLETRAQPGLTGCLKPALPILAGNELAVQGRTPVAAPCNSIPASAQVLVGNATSVFPNGGGFLTIYPSGVARPLIASSNYAGTDVINGPFSVKLGTDGMFRVYAQTTTDLVIDILGYYSTEASDANSTGLLFNPLPSPVRLLETRPDFPGLPLTGCTRTNAKIVGNASTATHTQMAANFCGLPAAAQAVVGNVSVVNTAGAGFLTLFPANLTTAPLVATSNYQAPATFGYNRHYIVGLSPADGKFKVLTQFTTDLILDASGYFAP
jgi:hypothetical protein